MSNKIITTIAMLMLLHIAQAQTNQTPVKWKFYSINQAGLLNC